MGVGIIFQIFDSLLSNNACALSSPNYKTKRKLAGCTIEDSICKLYFLNEVMKKYMYM